MPEILKPFAVVLLGLLGAGFLSGYETGIYCLNRYRLRIRAARGERPAMQVQRLLTRPHHLIASILLGTNVCIYLATAVVTSFLAARLKAGVHAELIATVALAPVFFVFADIIPKSIFRLHADSMIIRYRWPAMLANALLRPPATVLSAAGTFIGSIGARKGRQEGQTAGKIELLYHISESRRRGYLTRFQDMAVLNVLQLSEKKLRDVMVPLERVLSAPEDADVGHIRKMLAAQCFSRVPVYSGGRGNVTGVLHILDMPLRGEDDRPVKEMLRPPFFLAADTPLHVALTSMQSGRRHMVIVTGPTGAIGIATLKDIVEEVVGELAEW
jgi:CBS domain containing-hemolysin-like protein